MMKKLLAPLLILISMCCAVSAQPVPGQGTNVPSAPPAWACSASGCNTVPFGPFFFLGADGSVQFSTGATNSAVDYLQAIGGISGAGGSLVALSGTDANVAINLTAKGNANVNFANSGSGQLASGVDPGAPVSSGGQVQLTPSTSSGLTKIGNATYGVNLDCGSNKVCQVGGAPLSSDFYGYVVGKWYLPPQTGGLSGPTLAVANSIRCFPNPIKQRVTINALGLRVSALSVAGNQQIAIYAHNAATGYPTGTALVSTASISTTLTGSLNAAVSFQFQPNTVYWFCSNSDNATVTNPQIANVGGEIPALMGSATQSIDMQNSITVIGTTISQTFGTWPDLTSASFVDVAGSVSMPAIQFKPASIP